MEKDDWRRIQLNFRYLRGEVQQNDGHIINSLFEKGVLTDQEFRKIKSVSCESEKTEVLLFLLKYKPFDKNAYKIFCEVLEEIQPHIVEKLMSTSVDLDEDDDDNITVEDVVRHTLLKKFRNRKGATSSLPEAKRVILDSLKSVGLQCDWNEKELRQFITKTFTDVTYQQDNKQTIPYFRNIELKSDQVTDSTADVKKMTVEELCEFLNTHEATSDYRRVLIEICERERISGEVFLSLTENDINSQDMFSHLKFGHKRALKLLIDKLIKPKDIDKTDDEGDHTQRSNASKKKSFVYEKLRTFDTQKEHHHSYTKGNLVNTDILGRGNMIYPFRRFVHYEETTDYISKMAEETIAFSAACMNERINGTIYFGISPGGSLSSQTGEVIGCRLDKEKCISTMRQHIKESFTDAQCQTVTQIIRDPQFIDVAEGAGCQTNCFVVEVDVVPASSIVKTEVFIVKSKYPNRKKKKAHCYCFKDEQITVVETPHLTEFMKNASEMTILRQSQEGLRTVPKEPREGLKRKFLNLLTGGSETMEDDVYPVVLFSPLDEKMDQEYIRRNISFAKDIDSTVIFDFDPESDSKGLYQYVHNEGNVFEVLTTDNFDENGAENTRRDKYKKFLEELKYSPLKSWTFCNGYSCMEKDALSPYEWKQQRIEGFRNAVKFHYDDIPQGRAIVLVFLFSKNYDVMLEAADEIFTKFKDQWIIVADSEETVKVWRDQMIARNCADFKTLQERCVVGIPWTHLNETLCQVLNTTKTTLCKLPTSTGCTCSLREKVRQDMGDLDILSIEQCSDTDIASDSKEKEQKRRIVEEKFFRGGEVEWWNFWFKDDHVVKRDIHSSLMQEVRAALSKSEEADERVGVVTLLHQPGAGGTSSARQVLWELKEQYRCCLVKRITDQTCEQVTNLRSYEDADQPKPVLVLIDNEDDEKISNLYAILEDKARKASRDSAFPLPVFCVLLICQRRASLPIQTEAGNVQLKHELTKRELSWFETKSAQLEKKFKEGSKVNPKHLISFNILKENFDKEYVKRTVHTFVNDIKDTNELKVLKFLSLLNRFDVDFSHVPVACFDTIMQKTKRGKCIYKTGVIQRSQPRSKGWETGLSSSFRVLLNIASKFKTNGSKVQTLRIINYIMAEEILSNLLEMFNETIVDVMNQLLDSDIFLCESPHSNQLLTIIRNILKKRCYVDDRKEKFSTFVLDAIKAVDIDATVDVMIKVFDIDEDVNLAQQIARFYIQSKNWKMAEYYAKITTQKMHRNSFFWDTYAMVYKEQLLEEYTESTKTDSVIGKDKARQILDIALRAIELYRKEQEVSESEKSAANNAGYFGEIRVILLLLNIFPKFHGYTGSEDLHRFLVEETFVPDWIRSLQPEAIHHLKSMQKFSLHSLRRLDDEFHQLKSIRQTDFLPKDTHLTRDCLIKLKENLDHYFGEFSDTIPGSLSQLDAMEYRRSRVRTMGITSLAGALRLKEETLLKAFDIISENVDYPKPSSFDFVTVLTITIAYYAVTKKLLKNLSFQTVIDWSVKLYDLRQQQDPRPYLETFQYLVLFNLPTEDRQQYKLCPSSRLEEATKLWKETFYHNHPRQKDGERYLRKKDATYFFLGNGRDMDGLVYYEELGLWKKGNSDRVWRTEKALSRFRRMRGVLQRDGLEISMQLVTAGGNKFNLSIPTSLPIRNKSLLQKNVFFALGFGWAGLKAYDVTDEDLQDSSRFQKSQEQPGWIARYRLQTGTTKKLEDIMKSIRDVEASLEKTSKAGKGQGAKTEQKSLEKKLKFLIQERDDLLGGQ